MRLRGQKQRLCRGALSLFQLYSVQSAEGRSCSAPLVCGWLPRNKKIRSSKQEKQSTLKRAVMLCSVCIIMQLRNLFSIGREEKDKKM